MPKIQVPTESGTTTAMPDLNPDLAGLTKDLRNNLTARTTVQMYRDLAAPSDTSLPVMKGLGDALEGLAKGWQGLTETQGTLQQRLMEQMSQTAGKPNGAAEMMQQMMLYRMFQEMIQESQSKKTDDAPSWRDLLAEMEKRHEQVREAESKPPSSPIEQQLLGAMVQMMGQNLQSQLAPRDPMDAIRMAKAQVQELQNLAGGDPHLSLHERQFQLADKRLGYEHEERVRDIEDRKEARQQDYPMIANQVLSGLSQLAGQFGFRQDSGPHLVSPNALAAAQTSQATT